MRKLVQPETVTAAKLVVDFKIDTVADDGFVPLTTTVTLTDDRGKEWICTLKNQGVVMVN